MSQMNSALAALRRPRLLIRAARHGMLDYNRSKALRRLVRADAIPSPQSAFVKLLSIEADLEALRAAGDAAYNVARHVDVLIALMSEAQLLETRAEAA